MRYRTVSILCYKAIMAGYVLTHPRMFRHADGVVLLYTVYPTQCEVYMYCENPLFAGLWIIKCLQMSKRDCGVTL